MEIVMNNMKLTSVKILQELYDNFKRATVTTKVTLQKVTNRTLYLYTTDSQFREKIDLMDKLTPSGSSL